MRLFPCLLIGFLAACHGNLLAQEAASPPAARASALEKGPEADLQDLPEDLEEIRRALGPRYSIDSQELDIPYERPRGTGSAANEKPGANPTPHMEDPGAIDQELKDVSQTIRVLARRLERLAADAEDRSQYARADQLREIARNHWQSAREVLAPLPNLAAYSDISGPPWPSTSVNPPYVAPWVPPYTPAPRAAPDGPSRRSLPASQPPIPPFPRPQVDGDPRP